MKLVIKDTKLLFLYRSILFKFVEFDTKDKNLKSIVYALNIKDKKTRIEYIYDEGIKFINKYYSEDLCKFQNGQCIVQRKDGRGDTNGCCRICPIVTDKGCPSCNLSCKLIYCKTALGNMKLLKLKDIPILKCFSIFQRIILKASFFNTKEEIIKHLYYGIIYSSFKSLIGELNFNVYRKKINKN